MRKTDADDAEDFTLEELGESRRGARQWRFHWYLFVALLVVSNAVTWLGARGHLKRDVRLSSSQPSMSQRPNNEPGAKEEALTSCLALTINIGRAGTFLESVEDSKHVRNLTDWIEAAKTYMASPSEEADKAWEDLGINYMFFLIPESHAAEYALTRNHVHIPAGSNNGLGQGGYVAGLSTLHQLHCLNVLRKSLFFNQEHYPTDSMLSGNFPDKLGMIKTHTNHCVNLLRETIMCRANKDITPYLYSDHQGHSMPDYARERECNNFEGLREWAEGNQVPRTVKVPSAPEDVRLFREIYSKEW